MASSVPKPGPITNNSTCIHCRCEPSHYQSTTCPRYHPLTCIQDFWHYSGEYSRPLVIAWDCCNNNTTYPHKASALRMCKVGIYLLVTLALTQNTSLFSWVWFRLFWHQIDERLPDAKVWVKEPGAFVVCDMGLTVACRRTPTGQVLIYRSELDLN